MLKWAVNNSNRQSTTTSKLSHPNPVKSTNGENTNRRLSNLRSGCKNPGGEKIKSPGTEIMTNKRRKIFNCDKENNLTSTPLSLCGQSTSPLRRFDSLRDLSNISTPPENNLSTPVQTFQNASSNSALIKNNPLQYATTLPTFDVEYSPCSIVPGPILALRGISIADSYFEKPRYLANDIPSIQNNQLGMESIAPCQVQNFDFEIPQTKSMEIRQHQHHEDESINSSRMGDITLDRMIDAILESARKDRRLPKSKQQVCHSMSPTYTPAEDPASDLNEIWDSMNEKYLQKQDNLRRSNFNEREVRTPEEFNATIQNREDQEVSCHLRRQRAVRRKRQFAISTRNFIKSSIKNSTQKLFTNNSLLRKSFDELVEMDTPKVYSNLSPDSGRNSASDLEELGEDNNSTRRRLSYSPNGRP